MQPDAPILHDKGGDARTATSIVDIHGEVGSVGGRLRRGRRRPREAPIRPRACSTCIWRRTARSPGAATTGASTSAPARRRRSSPSRSSATLFGLLPARPPRLHRARRRRVRRQAGDAHRGSLRAGHAEDRPAGEVGVHPRGAVHRRHHAPPDDDAGQARRQARRHAHRDRRSTSSPTPAPMAATAARRWPPSLGSPLATYRCPNKKAAGYAVYTNMVPGRRLPRLWRVADRPSPSNAPSTIWRGKLGHRPVHDPAQEHDPARRLDRSRSGTTRRDVDFGSYGLDQCLDLVEQALASGRGVPKPDGDEWLEGTGIALAMLECGPPTEHRSGAQMALLPDGTLPPRGRLDRDGQRLGHLASADRRRGARRARRADRHHQRRYRPDALRHRHLRQHRHGRRRPGGGADGRGAARQHPRLRQPAHRRRPSPTAGSRTTRVVCGDAAHPAAPSCTPPAPRRGHRFEAQAQGLSLAAHGRLQRARRPRSPCIASPARSASCTACTRADIGRLINPMQCRGQIDGAIAHGLRLGADREHGAMTRTARW